MYYVTANLGYQRQLHTLDASHNELISTRGLSDCISIQVLDISNNHLTNIDELNKLCLLRHLTASANNIMEVSIPISKHYTALRTSTIIPYLSSFILSNQRVLESELLNPILLS